MPTYEIFTIGSPWFLWNIFNGVAMITDTNDWLGLISIGFLIGMLLIGFKAIGDQRLELHHMLIAFIIFSGMFLPKSTVIIDDVITNEAPLVVDNVPSGVAFVGSMITRIGYGITQMAEQAYQMPSSSSAPYIGLYEGGMLDDVHRIISLRGLDFTLAEELMILKENIIQYAATCTMKGISNKRLSPEGIRQSNDVWEAMKYPTEFAAYDYLRSIQPSVDYQETDCKEATDLLDGEIGGSNPALKSSILKVAASQLRSTEDTIESDISDTMETITGMGVDSYRLIINNIMTRYLSEGGQAYFRQKQDFGKAIIMEQALMRGSIETAFESTVFSKFMRPMITFIEGVVYAISPFMAFLLVMGPAAMKLGLKYLLLIAWIQLWFPILSIIKLYITLAMSHDLTQMVQASGSTPDAPAMFMLLADQMSVHMQTAGTLIMATPAIALMLVYGSSITATSLANQLGTASQQHTGAAAQPLMAPNLMSNSAGVATMGAHSATYTPFGAGPVRSDNYNTDPTVGTLQVGQGAQSAISDAQNFAREKMSSLSGAMKQAVSSTESGKQLFSSGETAAKAWEHAGLHGYNDVRGDMDSLTAGKGVSLSEEGQQRVMLAAKASAGLSAPLKIAAIGAAMEAAYQNGEVLKSEESSSMSEQEIQSLMTSESLARQYSERLNFSETSANMAAWEQMTGKTSAAEMGQMASESTKYSEQMSKLNSMGARVENSMQLPVSIMGHYANNSEFGDNYREQNPNATDKEVTHAWGQHVNGMMMRGDYDGAISEMQNAGIAERGVAGIGVSALKMASGIMGEAPSSISTQEAHAAVEGENKLGAAGADQSFVTQGQDFGPMNSNLHSEVDQNNAAKHAEASQSASSKGEVQAAPVNSQREKLEPTHQADKQALGSAKLAEQENHSARNAGNMAKEASTFFGTNEGNNSVKAELSQGRAQDYSNVAAYVAGNAAMSQSGAVADQHSASTNFDKMPTHIDQLKHRNMEDAVSRGFTMEGASDIQQAQQQIEAAHYRANEGGSYDQGAMRAEMNQIYSDPAVAEQALQNYEQLRGIANEHHMHEAGDAAWKDAQRNDYEDSRGFVESTWDSVTNVFTGDRSNLTEAKVSALLNSNDPDDIPRNPQGEALTVADWKERQSFYMQDFSPADVKGGSNNPDSLRNEYGREDVKR